MAKVLFELAESCPCKLRGALARKTSERLLCGNDVDRRSVPYGCRYSLVSEFQDCPQRSRIADIRLVHHHENPRHICCEILKERDLGGSERWIRRCNEDCRVDLWKEIIC